MCDSFGGEPTNSGYELRAPLLRGPMAATQQMQAGTQSPNAMLNRPQQMQCEMQCGVQCGAQCGAQCGLNVGLNMGGVQLGVQHTMAQCGAQATMWAGASPHKAPSLGGPMRKLGVSQIVSRMQAGASRGGSILQGTPLALRCTPPHPHDHGGAKEAKSAHRRPCPLWHWLGGGWGAAMRGHRRGS